MKTWVRRRHENDSPKSRSLAARSLVVRNSAPADPGSRRLEVSTVRYDVKLPTRNFVAARSGDDSEENLITLCSSVSKYTAQERTSPRTPATPAPGQHPGVVVVECNFSGQYLLIRTGNPAQNIAPTIASPSSTGTTDRSRPSPEPTRQSQLWRRMRNPSRHIGCDIEGWGGIVYLAARQYL